MWNVPHVSRWSATTGGRSTYTQHIEHLCTSFVEHGGAEVRIWACFLIVESDWQVRSFLLGFLFEPSSLQWKHYGQISACLDSDVSLMSFRLSPVLSYRDSRHKLLAYTDSESLPRCVPLMNPTVTLCGYRPSTCPHKCKWMRPSEPHYSSMVRVQTSTQTVCQNRSRAVHEQIPTNLHESKQGCK